MASTPLPLAIRHSCPRRFLASLATTFSNQFADSVATTALPRERFVVEISNKAILTEGTTILVAKPPKINDTGLIIG